MNSWMPWAEWIFMICERIGRPPISTIGIGRASVSSLRRVPRLPERMTPFMRRWRLLGLRDSRDERDRQDEGSVWFVKVNERVLLLGFQQESMIEGLVHPHSRFNQAIQVLP